MAELLTPGVIIQEVPFGPQPIEGVSTSTAGFVGETLYGPTEGPPTLVTSFPDFQRKFGGLVSGKTLGYALQGFFDNGGRRAYVARAFSETAAPLGPNGLLVISRSTDGTTVPVVGGISLVGTVQTPPAATTYRMVLGSVAGLAAGVTLTILDRQGTTGVTMTVTSVEPTTRVVVATAVQALTPPPPVPDPPIAGRSSARFYARIGATGAAATLLSLKARDKGAFSARLGTYVGAVYAANLAARAFFPAAPDEAYELSDVSGLVVGDRLEFRKGNTRAFTAVKAIDPANRKVTLRDAIGAGFVDGTAFLLNWQIAVTFDGTAVETLLVSGDPAALGAQIDAQSRWIRLDRDVGTPAPTLDAASATLYPTMPLALAQLFAAGDEAPANATAVIGSEGPIRSGIGALFGQDGINLIAAPGFTSQVVVNALITQAERLQDRFAVFESEDQADVNDVLIQRGLYNSNYAAMYHPWLRVRDPLSGNDISLPPSGHVLGAYARTDNDRGVFKAPANVVLRSVLGFTRDVSTGEQDVLNPQGVNVLRRFDGLGLVIWGARTVTADSLWKYVPVRRLFIFLEQSIVRGTRYAVFEPNAPPLWARIRDSVTNFLTSQWRSGALFGRTAAEAFFVKVDETTTTQDDRDNGRVNIIVGIAPVKPAEFVVFQIGQAPSSVIVSEQG